MSFVVSVCRLSDRNFLSNPLHVGTPRSEEWELEAQRRTLMSVPLATDADCRDHWSAPAAVLGLPLLAALFEQGLEVEGPLLDALDKEIETLTEHWTRSRPRDARSIESFVDVKVDTPLIAVLCWRAEGLRTAVRLAQRVEGFVSIF